MTGSIPQMSFYIGIVEDRNDPKQLGRVRVRVYGIHTDEKTFIPTNKLPWANVVQPTTSAGNSGVGLTSNLIEGTAVMVMFSDPSSMQYPIVMGTFVGDVVDYYKVEDGRKIKRDPSRGFSDPSGTYPKSEYMNEVDTPKLARDGSNEFPRTPIETVENELFSFDEPEDIRGNHRYPYNEVRQSEAGHYEEWDNTPGNERINTQHKSGTFEEIRPNGDKVTKVVGNNFSVIVSDNNVYVGGTVNLHIEGDAQTHIGGDWNVDVAGDHTLRVAGNQTFEIVGTQNIRASVTNIMNNVNITGDEDVSGNSTVGGNEDVSGNLTVGGNEDVSGNSTVGGMLTVAGNIIGAAAATITGAIAFAGGRLGGERDGSTIRGDLVVEGDVEANGVSLENHTHTAPPGTGGGETSPPN